jgi:hypothetical protein
MATGTITLKGVVRGKTIELNHDPGFPDGQEVTITVQAPAPTSRKLPPGEGLRRAFGAWAEDSEELNRYLEWNRQRRKQCRGNLEP